MWRDEHKMANKTGAPKAVCFTLRDRKYNGGGTRAIEPKTGKMTSIMKIGGNVYEIYAGEPISNGWELFEQ